MNETPPRSEKSFSVPHVEPVELSGETVDDFLAYASRAPSQDQERVREAIRLASKDHDVLEGLFERVERQRESDFGTALVTLAVIGELQNPEALDRLDRIVWEEAPKAEDVGHGALGPLDILEMLQSKAVEGMAYIGTEEADEQVFRVIRHHPSAAVRSTAVDAYLFNHEDSSEARDRIRTVVMPADAAFADRARLTGSGDRDSFNSDVKRFYTLHPDEIAPEPGRPPNRPGMDRFEPPTRYER